MIAEASSEDKEKFDNQLFYDPKEANVPESLKGIPVPSWYSAAGAPKIDQGANAGFVSQDSKETVMKPVAPQADDPTADQPNFF